MGTREIKIGISKINCNFFILFLLKTNIILGIHLMKML